MSCHKRELYQFHVFVLVTGPIADRLKIRNTVFRTTRLIDYMYDVFIPFQNDSKQLQGVDSGVPSIHKIVSIMQRVTLVVTCNGVIMLGYVMLG